MSRDHVKTNQLYIKEERRKNLKIINPFPPMSVKWHLQILLCLTPDDFTRQWGTP